MITHIGLMDELDKMRILSVPVIISNIVKPVGGDQVNDIFPYRLVVIMYLYGKLVCLPNIIVKVKPEPVR